MRVSSMARTLDLSARREETCLVRLVYLFHLTSSLPTLKVDGQTDEPALEKLARYGLAGRSQVRRVPLSFVAAASGLCALDRGLRERSQASLDRHNANP